MNVIGNTAGFRLEDLVCLIRAEQLEGTLTLRNGDRLGQLFFQGGLIVFPMPSASRSARKRRTRGSRRSLDVKRANRKLAEILHWQAVDFDFSSGRLPAGFNARRSVVIKPSRLLGTIRRVRAQHPPRAARVGMLGALSNQGLRLLLQHLGWGRYSGLLLVGASEKPLSLCFADGLPFVRRSRSSTSEVCHSLGDASGLHTLLPLDCVQAASFSWTRGKVANLARNPERFVQVAQPRRAALTLSA